MPQIIPIKDLKDTSAISDMCHRAEGPIFVTKNGYGDMVLMSMELFEAMKKKWGLHGEIEKAEGDIVQRRDVSAHEASKNIDISKYAGSAGKLFGSTEAADEYIREMRSHERF